MGVALGEPVDVYVVDQFAGMTLTDNAAAAFVYIIEAVKPNPSTA